MTVADLIEQLRKLDPSLPVMIDYGESGCMLRLHGAKLVQMQPTMEGSVLFQKAARGSPAVYVY